MNDYTRKEIGAAIQALMKWRGYSYDRLSTATDNQVGVGTIHRTVKGESDPKLQTLQQILKPLGFDLPRFYALLDHRRGGSGEIKPLESNVSTTSIERINSVPLISWVQAGALCEAEPAGLESVEAWLPCPTKISSSGYALRVSGNSMTNPQSGGRSYPDGCLIFVDPEREATAGDRIIARVGNQMTFKVLAEDCGSYFLQPLNPQFPTIPLTEETHICGVVVGKFED